MPSTDLPQPGNSGCGQAQTLAKNINFEPARGRQNSVGCALRWCGNWPKTGLISQLAVRGYNAYWAQKSGRRRQTASTTAASRHRCARNRRRWLRSAIGPGIDIGIAIRLGRPARGSSTCGDWLAPKSRISKCLIRIPIEANPVRYFRLIAWYNICLTESSQNYFKFRAVGKTAVKGRHGLPAPGTRWQSRSQRCSSQGIGPFHSAQGSKLSGGICARR